MKAHRQKRYSALALLLVLGTASALIYQNCAPLPEQALLPSALGGDAPFAFDVEPDVFSVMTCDQITNDNYSSDTYFTAKYGAITPNGGVSISTEFYDWAVAERKTYSEKLEAIQNSSYNLGTVPQVSMRNITNLLGSPTGPSLTPIEQRVQKVWMGTPLSDDPAVSQLLSRGRGEKVYLQPGFGSTLLGRLSFFRHASFATIQTILSQARFVIGFHAGFATQFPESVHRLVGPRDVILTNSNVIYGREFLPIFGPPSNPFNPNSDLTKHGAKTLGRVRVVESHKQQERPELRCLKEAQYRIMPSGHNAPSATDLSKCDVNASNSGLTFSEQEAFNAASAVLNSGGTRWKIDQKNRCIIPLQPAAGQGSCYATDGTGNVRPIDWNPAGAACDVDGNTPGTSLCPRYFSVCIK